MTGGAGFIGSHLVDALIDVGFNVRVLDNLLPPTHNGKLPPWFNKKAEFIKGDVRDKKDWIKALKGVSFIFHLAAYMDYHLDFSKYYEVNNAGLAKLYEVIVEKKLPVKKVVIASSQSVYGEGKYKCEKHGIIYPEPRSEKQLSQGKWEILCPLCGKAANPLPQKEDDLLKPTIPYGVSKKTSEEIVFDLGKRYDIPSVALRYTIVHGPRQSFRHFYSGALRQLAVMALAGEPMVMHEDGNQLRDYVNVRDVVSAHLTVLKNSKADFQPFNIGSGKSIRIRDLAKVIAKEAHVPFKPLFPGLYRVGAPRHSIASVEKLKRLGWVAKYGIIDNVKEYFEWIKNFPEAKQYFNKSISDMKKKKFLL